MEPDHNLGYGADSKLTGLSGVKRVGAGSTSVDNSANSDMIKKVRVSEKVDDHKNNIEKELVLEPLFDLNLPFVEFIDISSDDDDDKRKGPDNKGKGVVGYGNAMEFQRRYTRLEKGKEKVDEFMSYYPAQRILNFDLRWELDEYDQITDLKYLSEELQLIKAAEMLQTLSSVPESSESSKEIPQNKDRSVEMPENQDGFLEKPENQEELPQMDANLERERAILPLRVKDAEYERRKREERIERARAFAHFDADENIWHSYNGYKKKIKRSSNEAEMTLEDISGPFSSALKAIKDRNTNTKQGTKHLFKWHSKSLDCSPRIAPSLLDLSLDVLVRNADAIASIDCVPGQLKQRLANLLCDARKMDIHMLELFLKESPTEIRIKDCSWMTEAQLIKTFQKLDTLNLRVLQLDFCGQCSFDDIISNSLARSPNSLPCLGILSLRGAGRLSDNTLIPLVVSAPLLQSVNLSQCALLTAAGIKNLADLLRDNLRELYIDDCPKIDAKYLITPLKMFECLQVLSVSGIHTVCDEFVRCVTAECGGNLKELHLANCLELTNGAMKAIGNHCPHLCSLNISNLCNLTDLGLSYIANGCNSLQSFKIACNEFSDEAVAAFLETSGGSLNELSLNKLRKVGSNTAFSLAKCSKKLMSLDLSWCRRITNEALGLVVDSCSFLRLLKLFGCTQITHKFPSHVRIVGLNQTPLLQHVNMLEPMGVLLRYSPLKSPVLPSNDL